MTLETTAIAFKARFAQLVSARSAMSTLAAFEITVPGANRHLLLAVAVRFRSYPHNPVLHSPVPSVRDFAGRADRAQMSIYRANPKHGVAWITGGSTGIGRALALNLAREGYVVAVTVREQDPIDDLIAVAAGFSGRVLAFPCDVTDEAGMARTVAVIEETAGPIVLAIFNAGTYLPTIGERLTVANFRDTYAVNLFGVVNGLVPAVKRMQDRGRGHVVFVGSVTAYFGWPTSAAYGSTKAALNNIAEALRYDFVKMNVRVQVMNLGFVDTPLAAKNAFYMPALMPVEEASARMLRAIKSGGFEVTFPRRLTWGLKLLRLLPQEFVFRFITYATRWKARPLGVGWPWNKR
jgi:NAD(P)-dependent dehydrogenase (short-subunit alcohol dehydrogenase family)